MKPSFVKILALVTVVTSVTAQKIVVTNDDGWAVAQIRNEYSRLKAAGYQVILSAPAVNQSGSGSSTTAPTTLTTPCQFDTCPAGSPPNGTDAHDPNIHYVNGFPVDAVKYGIRTYAPATWGTKPDLIVSGPNIGNNLGNVMKGSGTIGAAAEAAKEGIPSFAFSGASGDQVSYTTLTTDPTAPSTINAKIHTSLVLKFLSAYLAGGFSYSTIVPAGYSVNINFSPTNRCSSNANNYKWIATRLIPSKEDKDTPRCGLKSLPDESTVSAAGCYATVSVFDASTKEDAPAAAQEVVFNRLNRLLTCFK